MQRVISTFGTRCRQAEEVNHRTCTHPSIRVRATNEMGRSLSIFRIYTCRPGTGRSILWCRYPAKKDVESKSPVSATGTAAVATWSAQTVCFTYIEKLGMDCADATASTAIENGDMRSMVCRIRLDLEKRPMLKLLRCKTESPLRKWPLTCAGDPTPRHHLVTVLFISILKQISSHHYQPPLHAWLFTKHVHNRHQKARPPRLPAGGSPHADAFACEAHSRRMSHEWAGIGACHYGHTRSHR